MMTSEVDLASTGANGLNPPRNNSKLKQSYCQIPMLLLTLFFLSSGSKSFAADSSLGFRECSFLGEQILSRPG